MTSFFCQKKLISLIGGLLGSCGMAIAIAEPVNHPDAIADYLEGVMTASVTPEEGKTVRVKMTTCRVEVPEENSIFLYQEQGLVGTLDKPYRQRFLEIKAEDDNLAASYSYKPEKLNPWINFCDNSDRVVEREQLGELVCTVILKPYLSAYAGTTPPEGCVADVRGAVKITNRIILHQQGMDTWDRGFDAAGNQVWGAEDEAYQFRRQ